MEKKLLLFLTLILKIIGMAKFSFDLIDGAMQNDLEYN